MDADDRRHADETGGIIFGLVLVVVWYFELWPFDVWYWNAALFWAIAFLIHIFFHIGMTRDPDTSTNNDQTPQASNQLRLKKQFAEYNWVPSIIAGVIASIIASLVQLLVS